MSKTDKMLQYMDEAMVGGIALLVLTVVSGIMAILLLGWALLPFWAGVPVFLFFAWYLGSKIDWHEHRSDNE